MLLTLLISLNRVQSVTQCHYDIFIPGLLAQHVLDVVLDDDVIYFGIPPHPHSLYAPLVR